GRLDRAVLVTAERLLEELGERARLHEVPPTPRSDLAVEERAQQLDGEVAPGHASDLGEELGGQDRDVGLAQTGRLEYVDDLVGDDRPGHDLADGAGDLEIDGEITWYGGAEFALEDFLAIIGHAATPGSRIV